MPALENAAESAPSGSESEKVYLPHRFKLVWPQESLALDVTLSGVKLNPPFDKRLLLVWVVKLPGNFLFTLGIAILLA